MNQFQRHSLDTLMADFALFDMQTSMKKIIKKSKIWAKQSIDKDHAKQFLMQEIDALNDEYSAKIVSLNEKSACNKPDAHWKKQIDILKKVGKNLDLKKIARIQNNVKEFHEGNYFFSPQYEENIIEQIKPIVTDKEFITKYADSYNSNIAIRETILKTYIKSRLSSMLRDVDRVNLETKIHAISKSNKYDIEFKNPVDRIKAKDVEKTILKNIDAQDVLQQFENLYPVEKAIDQRNKGFNLKYKFADHKFEDIELLASRFDIRLTDVQNNTYLGAIKSRLKRNKDSCDKRIAEMIGVRKDKAYDDFGTIELYPSFKELYAALPEIAKHRDSRKNTIRKFYGLPNEYNEEHIKEHLIQAYAINHALKGYPNAQIQKKQKNAMISQVQLKGLIYNLRIENNLQVGGFEDLLDNDEPVTNTLYSSLPRSIQEKGYKGDVHNEIYNGPVLAHKKYMLRRTIDRENALKDHNLVKTAKLLENVLQPIYKTS